MGKNNIEKFLAFTVIILITTVFAGCGAGSGQSSLSTQSGSYSLSVQWPDQGIPDKEKTIPDGSSTISVSITGQWISSPITTSIASGTTTLTISNVPVGNNIALIKALDASGNITAQRKESFIISENETTTADSVPLGIAITGSSSSPV